MANEYLKRTPTSTGNRRVWTWSTWTKRNILGTPQNLLCSTEPALISKLFFNTNDKLNYQNNSPGFELITSQTFRDTGNWMHVLLVAETTASISSERIRLYVNGIRITKFDTETYPAINSALIFNYPISHFISNESSNVNYFTGEFTDIFFIDGQALTPDVFGFYKTGKGYISAGSTVATDFRPGQWVPKPPRMIRADINNRGGFGVNGFYLPMNDSNNFGADFHCAPNSIIKLQENLPQPRSRIDGAGDYTGALRDDPFKQYLVLALPLVSNGLQNGFGDYSAAIKGSGTPKTVTSVAISGTGPSLNSVSPYYGTSAYFDGGRCLQVPAGSDFAYGTGPFTVECWVNPPGGIEPSGYETAFLYGQTNGGHNYFWFGAAGNTAATGPGALSFFMGDGGGGANGGCAITVSNIVPINQWSHVAVTRDSTNTVRLFLNGVCVAIAQNVTYNLNNTTYTPTLGRYTHSTTSQFYKGYVQDFRIYKGVAKYTGGFDVPRPYAPVGISSWRAVSDTTANNFAILNGTSIPSKYTVSNGNLTFVNSATNWTGWLEGTVGFSTGKYYWETRIDVSTDYHHIGIVGVGITHFNTTDSYKYGISYQADGRYWSENNNLSAFQTGITQSKTVGDIVMLAVDVTNKRMWVGKNGTWFSGDPSTASSPPFDSTRGFNYAHYVPFYDSYGSSGLSINFGQNPTFSGNTTAGTFTDSNGKGLFKYQPPAGFLALCEDNLPAPAISDPGKYFKTVLWTGNDATRSIQGLGFKPDLVWIKSRSTAGSSASNNLYDSLRPTGSLLSSNETSAEVTYPGLGLSSFDVDGFSITGAGSLSNQSPNNYVAWCWRAGAGTTTTNTNGSITSVVSVNQDAGFSIVSYTGTGSAGATIGHGLGKTPSFIIIKDRTSGTNGWPVYHTATGNTQFLYLNGTNASSVNSTAWNNTSPSSSVFTVGTGTLMNTSTNRYIAYCWAEIEGFSKFGSYVGNGSADGSFVYCGFKPALVIFKRTDNVGSWVLKDSSRDSTNPADLTLLANTNDAEYSSNSPLDFVSNGFKLRSASLNDTNGTFIFAAFAESPFQTANAK